MSRIELSSTVNTRDLGGYLTESGETTKNMSFLRSDLPINISDSDIDLLLKNGITTIVDLRSDDEVQRKPNSLSTVSSFNYYHAKLFGDGRLPKCTAEVPVSYFEIIEEQKSILKVLKIFANSNTGILYHCTAGKDRTGIITALLLLLAGVSKNQIIEDYTLSNQYLGPMLQKFCEDSNVDINIVTPKRDYMERFIDIFLNMYNSIEEYLTLIGLSSDEKIRLRNKMIKR